MPIPFKGCSFARDKFLNRVVILKGLAIVVRLTAIIYLTD